MVFQFPEYQLFKETVLQDIVFGPKILFDLKQNQMGEWEEKAKQILTELSFPIDRVNSSPFKLSGGQKRKVTLAGILILEPKVIVFDEPTLGLDPQSVLQVVDSVKQLNKKGATIILASSSMDFILEVANRILFFEDGRIKDNNDIYTFFRKCPPSLIKPKVIQFIEKLVAKNNFFENIWAYRPRNVPQLAKAIADVTQRSS